MYRLIAKTLGILSLACMGLVITATAQAPAQPQAGTSVIAVMHIDVIPTNVEAATQLLKIYRYETLKESGIVSCKIYQQIGRANHYTLVEEWADQAAYDAHIGTTHTRQFRDKIQPLLGGPLDERMHTELE